MGQVRLEPLKAQLVLLALSDIVNEARKNALLAQPRFADGKFNRKCVAISMTSSGYTTDADYLPLAGSAIMFKIAVMPLAVRRGHQHGHVFPDHLGFGEAEHLLGSSAEGQNEAEFVDDDHRIRNGREDRAEMGLALVLVSSWKCLRPAHRKQLRLATVKENPSGPSDLAQRLHARDTERQVALIRGVHKNISTAPNRLWPKRAARNLITSIAKHQGTIRMGNVADPVRLRCPK